MDLYDRVTQAMSMLLTKQYSTSFSSASRLFPTKMRHHIYNIYGLVRLADEVVDSYKGKDAPKLLKDLEQETYAALNRGYSTNPVVHAFQLTAVQFGIKQDLIEPFFASMLMDTKPQSYSPELYERYIHGSAEVIGLMCLRVFCDGNEKQYGTLAPGAAKLGSAYQKVNFLRDMAADYGELERVYFPSVSYETFDQQDKMDIIRDITHDFAAAKPYIDKLPMEARRAVLASYRYYLALLHKLEKTPAEVIKQKRIRLPNNRKAMLLLGSAIRKRA